MARSVGPSVGDKPNPSVAPEAVRVIGTPTRVFHPGPELLTAPHRGRRYGCSLSRRAPVRSPSSHHGGDNPRLSPTHPLGSPHRLLAYCGTSGSCKGFPSAASPALTAPRFPQCPRDEPMGGAAASGKSRGPPPSLSGLTEESRYGGVAGNPQGAPRAGASRPAHESKLVRPCGPGSNREPGSAMCYAANAAPHIAGSPSARSAFAAAPLKRETKVPPNRKHYYAQLWDCKVFQNRSDRLTSSTLLKST